ncbi:MAG: hypothetical protein U0R71_09120 [Solirubrobacterales bacterium]
MAVSVAGIASAGGSKEEACVANLCFKAGGGFSPKKLSKSKQTPIALIAEAKVKTTDGSHPPALNKVVLETDKNGAIDVKGYPTCKSGQLQSRDTKAAEKACKSAIIGTGTTTAEVKFEEQAPVLVHSKLLVINGGYKGGTTTLYIHAYFSNPIPGAIVTMVKIKKHPHGRYGLQAVATIPKIANGAGSITQFRLKVDKKFTYQGKKKSVLTAKCPDGRLQAHAVAYFTGGPSVTTEFVRPCTGT